jgi:hypothetical protein
MMTKTPVLGIPRSASEPEQKTGSTRRHPRLTLPVRCWIYDGQHTVYLRVHDVSAGGLSVRAPVPFAANKDVELRLELPGNRQVRARGQVVWVRQGAVEGPLMGARFVEFFDGESDLLKLLDRRP